MYSKSVLRAVAGQLATDFDDVDYFPSYELIAGHPTRATYYESNLRAVSAEGVAAAMSAFVSQHVAESSRVPMNPVKKVNRELEDDELEKDGNVACEEMLLEAFS